MNDRKNDFRRYTFSKILDTQIIIDKSQEKLGKVTDLVFNLTEPFPEAVGVYVEHGWNKPTEFIPWHDVLSIEDKLIIVKAPSGEKYPPFVDQPGWILINEHLMGRTILDMDGRKIEFVNDVLLLKSADRTIIVSVDISFNGFFRKWGMDWINIAKDHFIPWKYVQPLSIEDVGKTELVRLSLTRKQIKALPDEDLADALEELKGKEQQAVFSALDNIKAANVLAEAEPRTQRQLITTLRFEKAKSIFSEMSTPQLASLFSVLPHEQRTSLMEFLPAEQVQRINILISEHESSAKDLISTNYCTVSREAKVGEVIQSLKGSQHDYREISYVYVVNSDNTLIGAADLRILVLAKEEDTIESVMSFPVVVAEEDDNKDDLKEIFIKYHYRMIPVVDPTDHILGVIYYKDIIK